MERLQLAAELELDGDDQRRLRGFQLLSAKPRLLVHNVDEGRIGEVEPSPLLPEPRPAVEAVVVSAPIEQEITGLGDFAAQVGQAGDAQDQRRRQSCGPSAPPLRGRGRRGLRLRERQDPGSVRGYRLRPLRLT